MRNMLLIDSAVLPDVFNRVVEAKRLLASGKAKNATEAAKFSGISRSAFYKYKDSVFSYSDRNDGHVITIHTMMVDRPGVLSFLITELYRVGANILTVNQSIPSGGEASVSVSLRTDNLRCEVDEMLQILRKVDGVLSVTHILG